MSPNNKKLGFLGFAAAVAALCATPVAADVAKWDQARVTSIAQELAAAGNAWEQAVRRQPGMTAGSGDAEDEFGLLQNARVLREMSEGLAGNLKAGKGYDKTHNMYRSLKEKVDDSNVDAQRTALDEPTMDAWAKFADLLRQIAPYYDPKALTEPKSQ